MTSKSSTLVRCPPKSTEEFQRAGTKKNAQGSRPLRVASFSLSTFFERSCTHDKNVARIVRSVVSVE